MNEKTKSKLVVLMAIASVAIFTGCNKQENPLGNDAHDHAGRKPNRKTKEKAELGATTQASLCSEHGVVEEECGICHPELAARLKPGEGLKVRLPSLRSADIVGVRTATAQRGRIADGIECVAELSFDQNKLAQIAAPVSGIVQEVNADLGSLVEEKHIVAKIWSAGIAESVAKAVLSHQTLERERKLREQRVTSEQSLQEAEATHRSACQQLRTLGFTEEQIDALGKRPDERVLLEVRAPFAGEISERMAVRGALVEAGKALFTVVDRSTMWAMLQVPEAALVRVQMGQWVELRVESIPGRVFVGKLTWVGPAVDERTRMGRARAEFANPGGLLKDKMFARGRIVTREDIAALLVPATAVERVDGRPFVFVRLGEDLFEARAVELGARSEGNQEVRLGLKPEEQLAVSRAYALKSALLASRLGAGCVDD
jgi:cobalt-zinc-cadmium efflux system membrane fusion protein